MRAAEANVHAIADVVVENLLLELFVVVVVAIIAEPVASKLLQEDANHPKIISWSDSGKAFKIFDVPEFSLSVLPRYFRTKKFSSFQRNLNLVSSYRSNASAEVWLSRAVLRSNLVKYLAHMVISVLQYGFTKVRRGPDLDMYAHPAFVKGSPDALLYLRKLGGGGGSRKQNSLSLRPISPSTSAGSSSAGSSPRGGPPASPVIRHFQAATTMMHPRPPLPLLMAAAIPRKISGADEQRGCLDLLALAMEYADEYGT